MLVDRRKKRMPKKGQKVTNDTKQDVLSNEIKQKLEKLTQELNQSREREKRLLADYQNLLKRVDQEKSQLVKFANESLLMQLLPVLEHLNKVDEQLNDQGLKMVMAQIKLTLEQMGVEEIKALGEPFDVNTMEAVEQDGDGEIVIAEIQKGYRYKQKVLIHAKVILGSPPPTSTTHNE